MTDSESGDQPGTERLETTRIGVARVNLLPLELTQARQARRIAAISAAVLVVYLFVLGAFYVMKLGDVADARAERDATQAELAALRSQVEELAEFRDLLDDTTSWETLLTAAMDNEVSWARVLGDMALSFDADSSLVEISAATAEAQEGATDETATEAPDDPVGQIQFSGYSVERVAPGVQEVLLKITEGEGLFDSYLVTTAKEERGSEEVTNFEARVDLSDDIRTHRYDDGLPQESLE